MAVVAVVDDAAVAVLELAAAADAAFVLLSVPLSTAPPPPKESKCCLIFSARSIYPLILLDALVFRAPLPASPADRPLSASLIPFV